MAVDPQVAAYLQARQAQVATYLRALQAQTPAGSAFARQFNSWDINQRVQWLTYIGAGQAQIDASVRDWVRQNYGAIGAYLDHPEIGPILMQAGREGWAPEKLQATIQNTAWWKATNDAQRKFDLLTKQDPATANMTINAMQANIDRIAWQEGVHFTPQSIYDLTIKVVRDGITDPAQIKALIVAQAQYNPTHPVGNIGASKDLVHQIAREYLVPLNDRAAWDWAKQIENGTATKEGFQTYVHSAAQSRFPWMKSALEAGQTVKQIIDPYITQTAQLLEKSPDQIDPMGHKFAPILDHVPQGSTDHRMMTLAEAGQYIRGTPEYGTTQQAQQQAASVTQNLLTMFGQVAK